MHVHSKPSGGSRSILVVLIFLALVVAACSDDSSQATPVDATTTDTPTPAPEPSSAPTPTDSTRSDLETALLQFLGSEEGGVSALFEHDNAVEVATVGVANADGEPISADTSFYVGSISKVFTATLVMQLVDAGQIRLDERLSTYLPDTLVGANATVRSLLAHRSGIPSYTDNPSFFPDVLADLTRSWQPTEMLGYVSEAPRGVDNPFSYSNTNFVLLGMLVEQLHGKDLNSVLQSEIAEPLELSDTVFAGRDAVPPRAIAAPFVRNNAESGVAGTPYESVSSSAFAAGALISTPAELREFLQALSSGALVSPESLEEMTEPQSMYYGLGMELMDLVDDPVWLGHGGAIPGYRSIMALHPETGDVVVVLTNNNVLDPAEFARQFLGDR